MILIKNLQFIHLFILGKIGQCNAFQKKNKKHEVKKDRKIGIFLKGIVNGFGQKLAIFYLFLLRELGKKYVFYGILERKNAFVDNINKKSKKSKKWHFSKGVSPWFWSKIGNFSNFLFQAK